jgi:intraflagellar transport protein 122
MRVHEKWSREIEHGFPVWSFGVSDHLDVILVPAGNEVVPLDRGFGEIKTSPRLKAHKAKVMSVTVALNGKRFASADRDGVVVIWKPTGEGLVKYSHGSVVRAVAFDPLGQILASGSESEIGLWIPVKKTVEKTRTSAAVWTLKWSEDGLWLVAGFADGSVSGFDRTGRKRWTWSNGGSIKQKKFICWTLDIIGDQVLAGLWDLDTKVGGSIFFLCLSSGASISAPCSLDPYCQPTSAAWISSRSALVGTTRGRIELVTLGGKSVVKTLFRSKDSEEWITCLVAATKSNRQLFFYSSTSGNICSLKISVPTVHGQHGGVYAVRDKETLMEIFMFPCVDESCAGFIDRILTPQVVDNIALYNGKIACESRQTISVYSMKDGNLLVSNIETKSPPSSLLLLAELHVIVCSEPHKLVAFNKKSFEKEWSFPALIRYAKVVDGPPGRESVLVGLSDGQVLLAYLGSNSPASQPPVKILSHTSGIRFLDISLGKTEIAVIDEISVLSVYSLVNKKNDIIVSFPGISSVSFNEIIPSLLALTDAAGNVSIIDLEFPDLRSQQHVQGTVISFRHNTVSVILEGKFFPRVFVSISNIATRHSESKNLKKALSLASDDPYTLQIIAENCIQSGHIDLACKALARMNCFKKIISLYISHAL